MYTTWVMDQAVVEVRAGNGGVTVVLEDRGEIAMPVLLQLTTADGTTVDADFDVEVWEQGRAEVRVAVEGKVTQVVVDAHQQLPDVNRGDNGWTAGG